MSFTNSTPPALAHGTAKQPCPGCGKRTFKSYRADGGTGDILDASCGRCNRENNCGYHLPPREFFAEHPEQLSGGQGAFTGMPAARAPEPPPLAILDPDVLAEGAKRVMGTALARYLVTQFPEGEVAEVLGLYRCGLSARWPGAIAFPQLDAFGRVRQVKVMPYGLDGKRTKGDGYGARFVGKKLLGRDAAPGEFVQCFFGEHLLPVWPELPVAIVESEKTAIVCTLAGRLPGAIYLATGGTDGCKWSTPATFSVLRGRDVTLFPDDDAAGRTWGEQVTKVEHLAKEVRVRHLIASLNYPGKVLDAGHDLADVLLAAESDTPPPVLARAPTAAVPVLPTEDEPAPELPAPGPPEPSHPRERTAAHLAEARALARYCASYPEDSTYQLGALRTRYPDLADGLLAEVAPLPHARPLTPLPAGHAEPSDPERPTRALKPHETLRAKELVYLTIRYGNRNSERRLRDAYSVHADGLLARARATVVPLAYPEPDPTSRAPIDTLLDTVSVQALAERAERLDAAGDTTASAEVLRDLRHRYPGPTTEAVLDSVFTDR